METSTLIGLGVGYLLGSIPFTQIITKARKGIDLRKIGSGNVGGMNSIRAVGVTWGVVGILLDIFKSAVSVAIASALGAPAPTHLWAGLAAIAGHNWPIWLRFRGGKGLATALGLGLWVAWPATLISVAGSLVVLKLTKNMTFVSVAGYTLLLTAMNLMNEPATEVNIMWLSAGLVFLATLPNILELLRRPGGLRAYFRNPQPKDEI